MAIFRNPVTVLFLLVTINVFGHAIGAAINRNMSAQEVIDLIPPEGELLYWSLEDNKGDNT